MFVVGSLAWRATSGRASIWMRWHSSATCQHSNKSDDGEVRVRYAPSPTGYLHLGGLRTALYNALLAQHHRQQGRRAAFILRIEDTDRSRLVPGSAESLESDLRWLGIAPDESPLAPGDCGPYVQSERRDIYAHYMQRLFEAGHAYRCFCSPQTLDDIRMRQKSGAGRAFYDRRCLQLTDGQIAAHLSAGTPYTYRLSVPQGRRAGDGEQLTTTVVDELRGPIDFQNALVDDQVLMKSDGMPTYHFASVVDDHLMNISHVIRGEEWLASAPKHLLLYQAFGWRPPSFVHLPLLLNAADRSKLSKRQGDIDVRSYRRRGFLPEALLNFVAFLGWTPPDVRTDADHFMTFDQLASQFSLAALHRAPAVVDHQKLLWFNGHHLRQRVAADAAAVAAQLADHVRAVHPHSPLADQPDKLVALLKIAVSDGRVSLLADVVGLFSYLFTDDTDTAQLPDAQHLAAALDAAVTGRDVRSLAASILAAWQSGVDLLDTPKQLAKQPVDGVAKLNRRQLFLLLRQLLTATTEGPPLSDIVALLPPHTIERRLRWYATEQCQ